MKTIQVQYNEFSNWGTEIPVIVKDGDTVVWCNHVSTEVEDADFGHPDPIIGDWRDDIRTIEVCQSCDSWRYADGIGGWNRGDNE